MCGNIKEKVNEPGALYGVSGFFIFKGGTILTKLFLNEREMAERLGVSVAWMRKRRLTGDGPVFCKIGKLVRYPVEENEAYAQGLQRFGSTSAVTATI